MKCHIRIQGHLNPSWQEWFEGLAMVQEQEGTTFFLGFLADQAVLYGILAKMRRLGLTLLSLETSEVFSPDHGKIHKYLFSKKTQEWRRNLLWHLFSLQQAYLPPQRRHGPQHSTN